MENKKIGIIVGAFSLVLLLFVILYSNSLKTEYLEMGCALDEECRTIQKGIDVTHVGFGLFGFMLALGVYLFFFSKAEEKIMRKLEGEKEYDKFKFALKFLDEHERKVLEKIKENDGITQSTLRAKLDMSKAKLSYVLQDLEKRGIIKRVGKGKTLEVWLKI